MSLGEIMSQHYRDPDTAARIQALTDRGPSKVNPDVEAAMRGKKGKRPKVCKNCGEPINENHDDTNHRAREMDQGRL